MARYITKRVLRSLITMFIIITILFALLRLMPVEGYFENYDKMSSTQIQVKLQALGVTAPLPTQLVRFYKQVLHGDLGESNVYRKGVAITEIIAEKIPISLELGLISLCIALALGLPLGVIMARSTRTRFKIGDRLGTVFIVLVQAMPSAVYHILIQFLVAHFRRDILLKLPGELVAQRVGGLVAQGVKSKTFHQREPSFLAKLIRGSTIPMRMSPKSRPRMEITA